MVFNGRARNAPRKHAQSYQMAGRDVIELFQNSVTEYCPRPLVPPYSLAYNPIMPILAPNTVEIFSHSAEQTRRMGLRLGAMLQPGDLLCLQGDLGAGKTTFVQGLAQGWGAQDAVSSPTFVLVNVYRRVDGGQFFHLDAYRLESTPEAEELDFESMLSQGPLVIEWADRVRDILPAERLWIELDYQDEDRRTLRFNPHGARFVRMLAALRQAVYGAD